MVNIFEPLTALLCCESRVANLLTANIPNLVQKHTKQIPNLSVTKN